MAIDSYDPFDPAVLQDPYPYYEFLREQAPAYYSEKRDMYVLSRYDDVRAALANTEDFSSTEGVGYERRPVPMMIAYDPPEHTRLRRIVASRFTPRALAQWQPRIDRIVESLLDPLLSAGPVDFVEKLCSPLPVQVIAEMMDIPLERRADFKRWSDNTVEALGGAVGLTQDERMAVEMTIVEFAMYFAEVIRERTPRAAEADDLISLLIRPNEDGERLSDAEVVSFCVLLLGGGQRDHHEPDQQQRLSPDAQPGAVAPAPRPARARPQRDRGEPALRRADPGLLPQHHGGVRRARAGASPRAPRSSCCTAPPTATRASSRTPTSTASTATRPNTSRSASARTPVSARTSRGSRRARCCSARWRRSRACGSRPSLCARGTRCSEAWSS